MVEQVWFWRVGGVPSGVVEVERRLVDTLDRIC